MPNLEITLPNDQAEQLRELAESMDISVEELTVQLLEGMVGYIKEQDQ